MAETKVDLIEKMRQLDFEANQRIVNQAYDQLVDKQDRRVLPEDTFKEYFLPYFSGQESLKDKPEVLKDWVTIAGSGFAEVNLIDKAGEVVATVPGLNSTMGFQMTAKNVNLADAMRQTGLIGVQNPKGAQEYLVGTLVKHSENLVSDIVPDSTNETVNKWAKIFDMYGVKIEGAGGDKEPEQRLDEDVDFKP